MDYVAMISKQIGPCVKRLHNPLTKTNVYFLFEEYYVIYKYSLHYSDFNDVMSLIIIF